jgi:hypothetical protein
MHDVLLVGLSVALVSVVALYVFRTRGLREANQFLHDENIEIMDRAIQAERESSAARTELGFLKTTVVTLVQRPGVVVMTEEQFGILSNTIQQAVQAIVKPNSLN